METREHDSALDGPELVVPSKRKGSFGFGYRLEDIESIGARLDTHEDFGKVIERLREGGTNSVKEIAGLFVCEFPIVFPEGGCGKQGDSSSFAITPCFKWPRALDSDGVAASLVEYEDASVVCNVAAEDELHAKVNNLLKSPSGCKNASKSASGLGGHELMRDDEAKPTSALPN